MPRRLIAILVMLLAAVTASADRQRAVRSMTTNCGYAAAPAAADFSAVPQDGLVRTPVSVMVSGAACSEWSAWSTAAWITLSVEGGAVYLTIAPNTALEPRSATIVIAGVPMTITQLGRTNLLRNGSFDRDVTSWGWNQFPNSVGSLSWSPLDAGGAPGSGSAIVRDEVNGDAAFQRMQCVNATPGVYDYGFAVRSEVPANARPVIAFVPFTGSNCTGTYPNYPVDSARVTTASVWERRSFQSRLSSEYQSVMIVIGGYAGSGGAQQVWVDDVFLRFVSP